MEVPLTSPSADVPHSSSASDDNIPPQQGSSRKSSTFLKDLSGDRQTIITILVLSVAIALCVMGIVWISSSSPAPPTPQNLYHVEIASTHICNTQYDRYMSHLATKTPYNYRHLFHQYSCPAVATTPAATSGGDSLEDAIDGSNHILRMRTLTSEDDDEAAQSHHDITACTGDTCPEAITRHPYMSLQYNDTRLFEATVQDTAAAGTVPYAYPSSTSTSTSSTFGTTTTNPIPYQCELTHVSHLNRHGTRYPTKAGANAKIKALLDVAEHNGGLHVDITDARGVPITEWNKGPNGIDPAFADKNGGSLAQTGQLELFGVGHRLRKAIQGPRLPGEHDVGSPSSSSLPHPHDTNTTTTDNDVSHGKQTKTVFHAESATTFKHRTVESLIALYAGLGVYDLSSSSSSSSSSHTEATSTAATATPAPTPTPLSKVTLRTLVEQSRQRVGTDTASAEPTTPPTERDVTRDSLYDYLELVSCPSADCVMRITIPDEIIRDKTPLEFLAYYDEVFVTLVAYNTGYASHVDGGPTQTITPGFTTRVQIVTADLDIILDIPVSGDGISPISLLYYEKYNRHAPPSGTLVGGSAAGVAGDNDAGPETPPRHPIQQQMDEYQAYLDQQLQVIPIFNNITRDELKQKDISYFSDHFFYASRWLTARLRFFDVCNRYKTETTKTPQEWADDTNEFILHAFGVGSYADVALHRVFTHEYLEQLLSQHRNTVYDLFQLGENTPPETLYFKLMAKQKKKSGVQTLENKKEKKSKKEKKDRDPRLKLQQQLESTTRFDYMDADHQTFFKRHPGVHRALLLGDALERSKLISRFYSLCSIQFSVYSKNIVLPAGSQSPAASSPYADHPYISQYCQLLGEARYTSIHRDLRKWYEANSTTPPSPDGGAYHGDSIVDPSIDLTSFYQQMEYLLHDAVSPYNAQTHPQLAQLDRRGSPLFFYLEYMGDLKAYAKKGAYSEITIGSSCVLFNHLVEPTEHEITAVAQGKDLPLPEPTLRVHTAHAETILPLIALLTGDAHAAGYAPIMPPNTSALDTTPVEEGYRTIYQLDSHTFPTTYGSSFIDGLYHNAQFTGGDRNPAWRTANHAPMGANVAVHIYSCLPSEAPQRRRSPPQRETMIALLINEEHIPWAKDACQPTQGFVPTAVTVTPVEPSELDHQSDSAGAATAETPPSSQKPSTTTPHQHRVDVKADLIPYLCPLKAVEQHFAKKFKQYGMDECGIKDWNVACFVPHHDESPGNDDDDE